MARRFLGEQHVALARCEILLARIRLTREGPDAASPLLRQAAMIYRRSQSSDHWRGAEAESLLGECLLDRGLVSEAEALLVPSLRTIKAQVVDRARAAREAAARVERLERVLARQRQSDTRSVAPADSAS